MINEESEEVLFMNLTLFLSVQILTIRKKHRNLKKLQALRTSIIPKNLQRVLSYQQDQERNIKN